MISGTLCLLPELSVALFREKCMAELLLSIILWFVWDMAAMLKRYVQFAPVAPIQRLWLCFGSG